MSARVDGLIREADELRRRLHFNRFRFGIDDEQQFCVTCSGEFVVRCSAVTFAGALEQLIARLREELSEITQQGVHS